MTIQALDNFSIPSIAECFIACFTDYYVPMPRDTAYYYHRWETTQIDFTQSYGCVVDGKLVACLLSVVRNQDGYITAYNAGTGVLPEYRSQGLVKRLYKHAIARFKLAGIARCELEVIQENHSAINLYSSLGFKKVADLRCYSGSINIDDSHNSVAKEVSISELRTLAEPYNQKYAWDNRLESIKHDPEYKCYSVLNERQSIGYFILKAESGYVAQLEAFTGFSESWKQLFSCIADHTKKVKINNTDHLQLDKLNAYEKAGLTNTVNQFQMDYLIS